MTELDCLRNVVDGTISSLQYVRDKGVERQYSFEIDTNNFDDYLHKNITLEGKFVSLYKELESIKGPVLYWFEILSDVNRAELINRFQYYKQQVNVGQNFRNMPAIRKHIDLQSNVLYVGKVKANYHGRLLQHMGFWLNKDTQGLQLYHWTKDFPLQLNGHLMQFKPEMADMMGVIELAFARNLKPLIGKHK